MKMMVTVTVTMKAKKRPKSHKQGKTGTRAPEVCQGKNSLLKKVMKTTMNRKGSQHSMLKKVMKKTMNR